RGHGLVVEDGLPVDAAVHRLEYAARGRTRVVDARVAGHTDYGRHAVAFGADVAELHLRVQLGIDGETRVGGAGLLAFGRGRARRGGERGESEDDGAGRPGAGHSGSPSFGWVHGCAR